jgi:uncharacterized protein (DUF433 family)/flavin-binding protein dodecin
MPVITLTREISATAQTSPDEAIEQAITEATNQIDGVESVEVKRVELILQRKNTVGYRVTLKIAYTGESIGRTKWLPDKASTAERRSTWVPPRPSVRGLLRWDTEGVMRVGRTRVALDTVITAFRLGSSAEEIAEQYPSLRLADVYHILGYYLQHRNEVDAYLAEREREAGWLRERIETDFEPTGMRERLLARRADGRR